MNYSQMIKALREKMILSQKEFAQLLNVSYVSVNRWENGRNEPTIKVKRKLADLFNEYNITLEKLL